MLSRDTWNTRVNEGKFMWGYSEKAAICKPSRCSRSCRHCMPLWVPPPNKNLRHQGLVELLWLATLCIYCHTSSLRELSMSMLYYWGRTTGNLHLFFLDIAHVLVHLPDFNLYHFNFNYSSEFKNKNTKHLFEKKELQPRRWKIR